MEANNALTTTASVDMQVVPISALTADLTEMKAVLEENLGAGGLSVFDLPKIKIPSGGQTAFELTDLKGTRFEPRIQGVILFARDLRGYWPGSPEETGGGKPPSCHSDDCIHGIGDPGGLCKSCPLAQYGSARKGKGQACKQMKEIWLLRDGSGSILPENLTLPPTSLGGFRDFAQMIGGSGVRLSAVVVEVGLAKVKNANDVAYTEATFTHVRTLNAAERVQVQELQELYRPLIYKPREIQVQAIDGQAGILREPAGTETLGAPAGEPAWS
jgi:hypothetical protein